MSKIESLLSRFGFNQKSHFLNNVQWLTQKSNQESLLFYHFNNKNRDEVNLFNKRIKNADYGVCITNLETQMEGNVLHLSDQDYEKIKQEALDLLYPLNLEQVFLLGVTGTNGKTTVVSLAEQMALSQNKNVLSIGTLGVRFNGENIEQENIITSLSYIDLHKTLSDYQAKTDIALMELTSHGLEQKRYGNLLFDRVAWTNLSQDHLDYHGTMENYFNAKLLVLGHLKKEAKLILPEDEKSLANKINYPTKLVSIKENIKNLFFKVDYNLSNLSLACELIVDAVDPELIDFETLKPPAGRFNIIEFKNSYIIIDFAHSPDSLVSIGREIKKNFPDKKLITLFGCGGDRDKSKRPLMGKAASEYADHVIITSDNPRSENPLSIIEDIEPGVTKSFEKIESRSEAIKKGFELLDQHVLLIAGKGHEPYIEVQGQKIKYSDRSEVEKRIKEYGPC